MSVLGPEEGGGAARMLRRAAAGSALLALACVVAVVLIWLDYPPFSKNCFQSLSVTCVWEWLWTTANLFCTIPDPFWFKITDIFFRNIHVEIII